MAKPKKKTVADYSVAVSYKTPVSVGGTTEMATNKPGMAFALIRRLRDTNSLINLCIETMKHIVVSIPWEIVAEEEGYENAALYLETLFQHPNSDESYRIFWLKVLEDILTLDRGVIERVKAANGYFAAFYQVDGSTIMPLFDQHGLYMTPAYVQLVDSWEPAASFEKEELDVLMNSPLSAIGKQGYGKSPIERIVADVVTYIQSQNFNSKTFTNSNIPPSVINLKTIGPSKDSVDAFKAAWDSVATGNPFQALITNVEDMEVHKLRDSSEDMQYYELMLWIAQIIVAAYEMSPQDIGLTMNINKATGEVQQNLSKNQGIKNILDLLAEWHNEIIRDLALKDRKFAKLCFKYMDIDKLDEKTQAEIDKLKAETLKTYKEINVDPEEAEEALAAAIQEAENPKKETEDSPEEVEDDREESDEAA